jgi:hypothetical protein
MKKHFKLPHQIFIFIFFWQEQQESNNQHKKQQANKEKFLSR